MASYPRPKTFRSARLREVINALGANGDLECMECGANDGTIVAAHTNQGKGLAIKAPDSHLLAICARCHSRLDQPGLDARTKALRRDHEDAINLKTLRTMIERGYLLPV